MGKLVTSLTMTAFYVLLYYVWVRYYGEKENQHVTGLVYGLAALRAVLCLFPQNGWLTNSSGMLWGAIPMLGMLMLPKTVCYIIIILTFYKATMKENL